MRICVFEDRDVALLEPLTLTRAAFDLCCGASTLLNRQRRFFAAGATVAFVRPQVAELCRLAHPNLPLNDASRLEVEAAILVNARWLPPPGMLKDGFDVTRQVALVDGQIAYAVAPPEALRGCTADTLGQRLEEWKSAWPRVPAGGTMIKYPWDLFLQNGDALLQDEERFRAERERFPLPQGPTLVGPEDRLFVSASAHVEPLVFLDTTKGPVIVEREALVKAFTRLEGPCYIGPKTWVLAAQVSGSTIGPVCRIGGEVEGSIVHGHSNKAHEGFLGHSYVGEWVNLAAGTQVSDLRNDYAPITMTVAGQKVNTGQTKIGSFLGDHTKTGINTLLNTGTMAGAFCQVFPSNLLPPRLVPSFSMFARGQLQEGPDTEALLATAATVMRRRSLELTDAHRTLFRGLREETAAERKQLIEQSVSRSGSA
jgi:UDP-N-acetylglucosamine diphosphorylase/glucosamine-1-phosphate N-acetyltransferase